MAPDVNVALVTSRVDRRHYDSADGPVIAGGVILVTRAELFPLLLSEVAPGRRDLASRRVRYSRSPIHQQSTEHHHARLRLRCSLVGPS
jgi:hypothetical protein